MQSISTILNRKLQIASVLICSTTSFCYATDFDKGKEAFQRHDYVAAEKLLQPAAADGNAQAQYLLMQTLDLEPGRRDAKRRLISKTMDLVHKSAAQGYRPAQRYLGLLRGEGPLVPKDTSERVKLYEEAAKDGEAWAQASLGEMCESGAWGVPKSETRANELRLKAAKQGHAGAMYALGLRAMMKEDFDEALQWFRLASERGDEYADRTIFDLALDGHGTEHEKKRALAFYQRTADDGNSHMQYRFGMRYLEGKGVPRDATKAIEWFTRASKQGETSAQVELARCLSVGKGVAADPQEAYRWLQRALMHGASVPSDLVKSMESQVNSGTRKSMIDQETNWKPVLEHPLDKNVQIM